MLTNDRQEPVSPKNIAIEAYDYALPDERIARFPLEERDASKLLIYKNKAISESIFSSLHEHLPEGAVLVFNDTRVIHARFRFTLDNGKPLEVFCLEPLAPHDYAQNLGARESVVWKCLVGGNRHWKSGVLEQSVTLPDGHQLTLRL